MQKITCTLATAPNRKHRRWHNDTVSWDSIVERCRQPLRTHETVAQFRAMSREQQSEIKDVGGFVGGYLRDGARRADHVEFRTILTLDADFAGPDFWERVTSAFDCAAMIYSTHKHTEAKPRLRLMFPLSRRVTAAEYVPLGRRVASMVGIDFFDHTTYDPSRLMYWPSVSADGPWLFREQAGEALDVDALLATYDNPLDASEWPLGSRESEAVARSTRRAGDPRAKAGVVGAFCRVYDVPAAIEEYLREVYVPTADPNRYTYAQGSVAGGAVLYGDGQWLYSYHESDPAGGRLLNAFDLVRLHLYGSMDAGCDPDTGLTRLPSYREMCGRASDDRRVRLELLRERAAELTGAAVVGIEGTERTGKPETSDDWKEALQLSRKGELLQNVANAITILECDPAFAGKLWHNDFDGTDCVEGELPWRPAPRTAAEAVWGNADDARLRVYLETKYDYTSAGKLDDALVEVFRRHRRHPVRDYFNSLRWDRRERLGRLFIDYLGADDTEYNREVTEVHFAATVARIFEPGCKYDMCPVLVGPEGCGKSTALAIMGGEGFNDSLTSLDGKAPMEQLQGCFLIELGELAAASRAEVERTKAFISSRCDTYRSAYARRSEPHPRQCTFAATTNEAHFLKSQTGDRRFNPVTIRPELSRYATLPERFAAITADRDQLWAEAVEIYRSGRPLYLRADVAARAREIQREHNVESADPMRGCLEVYLDTLLPADWDTWDVKRRQAFFASPDPVAQGVVPRERVCPVEFLVEGMGIDRRDTAQLRARTRIVTNFLRDLGWECTGRPSSYVRKLYGLQKPWVKTVTEPVTNVTKSI